jgi:uncharacterized membrane protein YdbT with pleckstrin-like domain
VAFPEHDPADDEEQIVMDVRPHWYGLVVPTLAAAVVLVLAVVGVSFVSARSEGKAVPYAIAAVAAVLLIKYSVLPWLRRLATRYILTTKHLIVAEGVLRRSRVDIPLSHIGEVQGHSTLIQNLFGCGTWSSSAGTGATCSRFRACRDSRRRD